MEAYQGRVGLAILCYIQQMLDENILISFNNFSSNVS